MKLSLVALLAIYCCVSSVHGYHFLIDSSDGKFIQALESPEDGSISWSTPLTTSSRYGCSQRGVLKLDFDAEDGRTKKDKVLLDMWFDKPFGTSFNIGDSTSNNGGGGDSGDFSNDAEIQSFGRALKIFGNEVASNQLLLFRPGVIQDRLQIIISKGQITWNSFGKEFNSILRETGLFALNSESDTSGASNSDVYIGINRGVTQQSSRFFATFSRGLCRMEITWLDWTPV